jgi:hypothetical protein
MAEIDFAAEGRSTAEGGTGVVAALLTELANDGVPRRAAPRSRRIAGAAAGGAGARGRWERLTAAEVAERAGIDEEFLRGEWGALGMAASDDAAMYSEFDVEARAVRAPRGQSRTTAPEVGGWG